MAASCGPVPVILVHGWKSHPGVWNRFIPRLDAAGIPYSRFSHAEMGHETLPHIAGALMDHVRNYRTETGYDGVVDIVTHSMGTCIARYFLEVMDRAECRERVRQLIGIGPPNNGSALAKLFTDPEQGALIINRLTGVFVPEGFDPEKDEMVRDVQPESPVMNELRTAGIRKDIRYHIIVSANPEGTPAFFPTFGGRTWEIGDDGRYRMTLEGDGVVAHRESRLPGISLDIIRPGPEGSGQCPSPALFCHINLPKNPAVMDRIMEYLAPAR
jgi:pimeloyl-ACP methyl ester carboxylesterase